jgi:UDP-N-acetylmuramoyl-L-alanyl-D-glutamate--2,6-diaminopimelate ligase
MKKATKKTSLKPKLQKTKAKVASTLSGQPAKNLKIIAITGSTGKNTVANFIHKILISHKVPAALITSPPDSPLSSFALHRYLAKSLKSGATHVVIEAPATVLKKHVFFGLPIHMAVLTNTTSPETVNSGAINAVTYKSILFKSSPHFIILNRDDPNYDRFATYSAKTASATYGRHKESGTHIYRSKLYKKGTETSLSHNSTAFEVATFVVGEKAIAYMAAATAAAAALGIPNDTIIDGIASYEPTQP